MRRAMTMYQDGPTSIRTVVEHGGKTMKAKSNTNVRATSRSTRRKDRDLINRSNAPLVHSTADAHYGRHCTRALCLPKATSRVKRAPNRKSPCKTCTMSLRRSSSVGNGGSVHRTQQASTCVRRQHRHASQDLLGHRSFRGVTARQHIPTH